MKYTFVLIASLLAFQVFADDHLSVVDNQRYQPLAFNDSDSGTPACFPSSRTREIFPGIFISVSIDTSCIPRAEILANEDGRQNLNTYLGSTTVTPPATSSSSTAAPTTTTTTTADLETINQDTLPGPAGATQCTASSSTYNFAHSQLADTIFVRISITNTCAIHSEILVRRGSLTTTTTTTAPTCPGNCPARQEISSFEGGKYNFMVNLNEDCQLSSTVAYVDPCTPEFIDLGRIRYQGAFYDVTGERLADCTHIWHVDKVKCFPYGAKIRVRVPDGVEKTIAIENLSECEGCAVQVGVAENGEPKWGQYLGTLHQDPQATAEFVRFTTENGEALELSRDHFLWAEEVATGKRKRIQARALLNKEYELLDANGQTVVISKVEFVTRRGYTAPWIRSAEEGEGAHSFLVGGFRVDSAAMTVPGTYASFYLDSIRPQLAGKVDSQSKVELTRAESWFTGHFIGVD